MVDIKQIIKEHIEERLIYFGIDPHSKLGKETLSEEMFLMMSYTPLIIKVVSEALKHASNQLVFDMDKEIMDEIITEYDRTR